MNKEHIQCMKNMMLSVFVFLNMQSSLAVGSDDVFYSAYVSYGDKWGTYSFLEDQVNIQTLNFTGQVSSGGHSFGINVEQTASASVFGQVGVTGRVSRSDISFNIGSHLFENFSPTLISTPYVINYFYGYAKGETRVSFDDGVWLTYSQSGAFAGLSGAVFFEKWLASLSSSLSRGYWFDTRYDQRSSDGGIKSLDGISSGWSLSMNYTVPINALGIDNDVFIGFKSNNYSVVIDEQGGGLPYIKERLIFYYVGMSVYY